MSGPAVKSRKCVKCGRPFDYVEKKAAPGGRRKEICEGCRRQRYRLAHRRLRQKHRLKPGEARTVGSQAEERPSEEELDRLTVAEEMGVRPEAIRQAERVALYKIRNNPELRQLWQEWQEEGCPRGVQSGEGKVQSAEDWEALVAYQLEIAGWYERHEQWVAAGLKKEAVELLREIKKCQAAVGRAMRA